MGTIYKRGRVWWIKVYRPGQTPRRFSAQTTDRRAAANMLKIIEGNMARGLAAAPSAIRFSQLTELVLDDYRLNARRSTGTLEARFLHILPVLGNVKVSRINTATVRSYAATRQREGAANATINRELAAIRRALMLGLESGLIPQVPKIPMLAEAPPRAGFFGDGDIEALCAHLPAYLIPFVRFAYITGWRRGEIRDLEWRHIDWERREVRLEPGETKNGEGRTFPMTPEIETILRERATARNRLAREGGTIYARVFWHNHFGTIAPIRDFRSSWKKACAQAGIPGRIFHDLRRSAIRNMVRKGVPERVAMMLSGHRTRSVFDRYNIIDSGDLELARETLRRSTAPVSGTISGTVGRERSPDSTVTD